MIFTNPFDTKETTDNNQVNMSFLFFLFAVATRYMFFISHLMQALLGTGDWVGDVACRLSEALRHNTEWPDNRAEQL